MYIPVLFIGVAHTEATISSCKRRRDVTQVRQHCRPQNITYNPARANTQAGRTDEARGVAVMADAVELAIAGAKRLVFDRILTQRERGGHKSRS